MKISELSRASGVSIPTIKYYIREGLLKAGATSSPNQAHYTADHLEDLGLIRALREEAGLSIAQIRRVIDAAAVAASGQGDAVAAGVQTIEDLRQPHPTLDPSSPDYIEAWQRLHELFEARGWTVPEQDPNVQELLRAVMAVKRVWPEGAPNQLWDRYLEVAEELASFEITDAWDPDRYPTETLKVAVAGTMLYEPVILALRRMALARRHTKLRERRAAERTGASRTSTGG